ncbi:hypothetical protein H310_09246 [Aphanomyces invadans]|uniref:PH domain-containing protein n=1 Tax=Aphanomyces invadans TaxID=157072 RepID=A0A024TWF2_9STRA|nr:hypothetical protein H310_09246 [Aphanomyces invadans]ETV97931.1 hypothetical protein H310_09246 [Aphanomyces invadans]|eukprot:XP_008873492.1 hypothetical protein H310_09246 [Aphanomyces invadans]
MTSLIEAAAPAPSTCPSSASTMTEDNVVRTGILYKKGSKTGFFGRRNWKPRYFTLTWNKLSYYLHEGGELKGEIDLRQCTSKDIQVMPEDCKKTGHSASSIWRISVSTPARRLFIAAVSEYEMNEWLEDLMDVISRLERSEGKASDVVRPSDVNLPTSFVRPSLMDSVDLLARANPRRFTLMPARVHLRRRVIAQQQRDRFSCDGLTVPVA